MNWDALGAIGEIVGAAGVVVSLLYLAGQVRHNSRQVHHAAAQAVLDKLNSLIHELAFTVGAGDVWSRGLSGLHELRDDEELVRFSSMLLQAFWAYEEIYHYRKAGVIEDWAWTHSCSPAVKPPARCRRPLPKATNRAKRQPCSRLWTAT